MTFLLDGGLKEGVKPVMCHDEFGERWWDNWTLTGPGGDRRRLNEDKTCLQECWDKDGAVYYANFELDGSENDDDRECNEECCDDDGNRWMNDHDGDRGFFSDALNWANTEVESFIIEGLNWGKRTVKTWGWRRRLEDGSERTCNPCKRNGEADERFWDLSPITDKIKDTVTKAVDHVTSAVNNGVCWNAFGCSGCDDDGCWTKKGYSEKKSYWWESNWFSTWRRRLQEKRRRMTDANGEKQCPCPGVKCCNADGEMWWNGDSFNLGLAGGECLPCEEPEMCCAENGLPHSFDDVDANGDRFIQACLGLVYCAGMDSDGGWYSTDYGVTKTYLWTAWRRRLTSDDDLAYESYDPEDGDCHKCKTPAEMEELMAPFMEELRRANGSMPEEKPQKCCTNDQAPQGEAGGEEDERFLDICLLSVGCAGCDLVGCYTSEYGGTPNYWTKYASWSWRRRLQEDGKDNCWKEMDLPMFPEFECVSADEQHNEQDTCWYFNCGEQMARQDMVMEKGSSLEECCYFTEAFTLGNLGAAICPKGTHPITDQDQCHRASGRLGLNEDWWMEGDDVPADAACYVDTSEATKEEMDGWAEGKTSMMARGGAESRLLCNDGAPAQIKAASMGSLERSFLGDGTGTAPGQTAQIKPPSGGGKPLSIDNIIRNQGEQVAQLEAMCPKNEPKAEGAPECSCSFIGKGTDVRVGALCYAGEVCYNMVESWCAEDEAVCMTP